MSANFESAKPPAFTAGACDWAGATLRSEFASLADGSMDVASSRVLMWHIAGCETCHELYCAMLPDIDTMTPLPVPEERLPSSAIYDNYFRYLLKEKFLQDIGGIWWGLSAPTAQAPYEPKATADRPYDTAVQMDVLRMFLLMRRAAGRRPTLSAPGVDMHDLLVSLPELPVRVILEDWEEAGPTVMATLQEAPSISVDGTFEMAVQLPGNRFAKGEGGCILRIQRDHPPIVLPGVVHGKPGEACCELRIVANDFPVKQHMSFAFQPGDIELFVKPFEGRPDSIEPDFTITDDRYMVYHLIPGWDVDTVRKATVFVAGAGALGNEVVKNLTLMGVGTILVLDNDQVESNNLSRSILFRAEDEGVNKVDAVKKRVAEINPDVRLIALHHDLFKIGLGYFRRADVVISCIDSLAGRQAINDACWTLGKQWVDGGLGDERHPFDGYVHTFLPNQEAACYECTLTDDQLKHMHQGAGCGLLAIRLKQQRKIPTTPTCASIIGALQAQEALKMLHPQMELRLANRRFYLPGSSYEGLIQDFKRKPTCETHMSVPGRSIREMESLRAETTTARELLDAVVGVSGSSPGLPGEEPSLLLREDFVREVWCPSCGLERRKIDLPLSLVKEEDRVCKIHKTPHLDESVRSVSVSSDLASLRLSELGFPPLDVVFVAIPDVSGTLRYEAVELSGDAVDLFPRHSGT